MKFYKSSIDDLKVTVPFKSSHGGDDGSDDGGTNTNEEEVAAILARELADLQFEKSDSVYPQTKKKNNNNGTSSSSEGSQLPLFDISQSGNIFGKLNEIEYSANIVFRDAPTFPPIENGVCENVREYFSTDMELFMDLEKISNAYFDCSISKQFNVVFRIDRERKKGKDANTVNDDTEKISKSSVKVKVFKEVFVCRGVKASLTGSVELPYNDISLERKQNDRFEGSSSSPPSPLPSQLLPINGNKRLRIVYWNVIFTHSERRYVFKVAFRFHEFMSAGSKVLCNIECESMISGEMFMIIFHLLYSYYKQQFDRFNGFIHPTHPEFRIVETKGISDFQRKLAETYTHCEYLQDEDVDKLKGSSDYMHQFIKFLGMKSFMEYVPDSPEADVTMNCSDSFSEIEEQFNL
jgi:hypothetical protein